MGKVRGRKKRRRRRISVSRENRIAMIAITLVVCFLFAVLAVEGVRLNKRIDANEARRQQLISEIEAEEYRTGEIEQLRDEMKTEEFIRQAAKERLGLVEDNEIIFKSAGAEE